MLLLCVDGLVKEQERDRRAQCSYRKSAKSGIFVSLQNNSHKPPGLRPKGIEFTLLDLRAPTMPFQNVLRLGETVTRRASEQF